MSISISRSLRVLSVIALVCAAFPASAIVTRHWVLCPTWSWAQSGMTTSPADATIRQFAIDYPYCVGPALDHCSAPYENPTYFTCYLNYGGPGCPTPGYVGSPSYAPFAGGPIVLVGNDSHDHCAGQQSEDPKNLGDPCPETGNSCGNPVNIGTGNKFQRETDLPKTGQGGLEFTRFYNSAADPGVSDVGIKWTHTWSRSALRVTATDVKVTRPDGKALWFVLSGGFG
jgi:hypothetical protein